MKEKKSFVNVITPKQLIQHIYYSYKTLQYPGKIIFQVEGQARKDKVKLLHILLSDRSLSDWKKKLKLQSIYLSYITILKLINILEKRVFK